VGGQVVSEASTSFLLTEEDKELIKKTWALVRPIRDTAADLFYRRLFELKPEYRALFHQDIQVQKRKLMTMLSFVVSSLDWPQSSWSAEVDESVDLFLVVLALGRRHRELYAVPNEAYETVAEALFFALDYGLGGAFTAEARRAWGRVYQLVATTMKLGSGAIDMGTPVEPEDWGES
jgi:hemoglobin-like flavoprotein